MHNQNFLVLGFDFGTKRIGVAVGQTLTKTAKPLATISAQNGVPDWNKVDAVIQEWHPKALVVGKPLNMDGTRQTITEFAEKFAATLQERYQLPVYEMDERLSTVAAREKVFSDAGYRGLQKKAIDGVAAQLILESWLMENF